LHFIQDRRRHKLTALSQIIAGFRGGTPGKGAQERGGEERDRGGDGRERGEDMRVWA